MVVVCMCGEQCECLMGCRYAYICVVCVYDMWYVCCMHEHVYMCICVYVCGMCIWCVYMSYVCDMCTHGDIYSVFVCVHMHALGRWLLGQVRTWFITSSMPPGSPGGEADPLSSWRWRYDFLIGRWEPTGMAPWVGASDRNWCSCQVGLEREIQGNRIIPPHTNSASSQIKGTYCCWPARGFCTGYGWHFSFEWPEFTFMAVFYLWNGVSSIYRVMESVFFIVKWCVDLPKSLVTRWVGLVGRTCSVGTC